MESVYQSEVGDNYSNVVVRNYIANGVDSSLVATSLLATMMMVPTVMINHWCNSLGSVMMATMMTNH